MGSPVDFEGANQIFRAPEGYEDKVVDLPVFRNSTSITFAVLLSEEEIAEVARTGVVWVNILGHGMSPTAVSGLALVQITEKDGTVRDAKVVRRPIENNKVKRNGSA